MHARLGITKACADALNVGEHQLQGAWGRAAHPVGSARGEARSHPKAERSAHQQWARERSPLAKSRTAVVM